MGENLKKLTILHSNDIHGKFAGEKDENGKLKGSLAQVAAYVNDVKNETDGAVYCIAGDVFQGSLIDSDFMGLSTIDILNQIPIDVMSLGNHELDYGISHMLFIEKCADFKIVNTNFRIKHNGKQMFKPYQVMNVNGLKILFVGLLTKNIVDQTKAEGLVGTYVTVEDSKKEVERIIRHNREDKGAEFDLIVLMTHIGYEDDLKLAAELDPELNVDLIVGAHSHTYIDEPAIVNDIMVVQAGMENTHIGRLDLVVDTDAKKIDSWKWEMIPVDEDHCPTDRMVKAMISTYVMDIDEKYSQFVTRLARKLDNHGRQNTTECGQMFADAFADATGVDIFLLASSSMRCYSMDMTVTLQHLKECYPYEGKLYKLRLKGSTLRKGLQHSLRDEVFDDHAEVFYDTNKDLKMEYDRKTKDLQIWYKGKPLEDDRIYIVGMQEFYYLTADIGLGMTPEELQVDGKASVMAASAFETIKEYMMDHPGLGGPIDDRCIIHQ